MCIKLWIKCARLNFLCTGNLSDTCFTYCAAMDRQGIIFARESVEILSPVREPATGSYPRATSGYRQAAGFGSGVVFHRTAAGAVWQHAAFLVARVRRPGRESHRVSGACRRLCPATGQIRQYRGATSGNRLWQAFGYGTEPLEPGNRAGRQCSGQDSVCSPKRAPNGRRVEDGQIRPTAWGVCSGAGLSSCIGTGPARGGGVLPRASPRCTDPGSFRSRVHEPSWLLGRRVRLRGTHCACRRTSAPGASITRSLHSGTRNHNRVSGCDPWAAL